MLKVREEQPHGDYSDPGWYEHPPGTVAFEYTGELAEPTRFMGDEKTATRPAHAHTHDGEKTVAKAVSQSTAPSSTSDSDQ